MDDLTSKRAEVLVARPGPPLARLAWLALRYGRTEELVERMPEWVALFAEVYAGPDGTENVGLVIRYLLHVGDGAVREATGQVLHSVMDAKRAEELMRSYGEELIEEGRQRGLQQGLEQGLQQGRLQERAETVLRILAVRGMRVGDEARKRILMCTDGELLDRWVDRALHATSLSHVLDDPTQ